MVMTKQNGLHRQLQGLDPPRALLGGQEVHGSTHRVPYECGLLGCEVGKLFTMPYHTPLLKPQLGEWRASDPLQSIYSCRR